ncbi:MAG: EscU/YscU/HrcU family type III secretion system export apparatus switch protein, partial [Phenylobacterium sp.]|nr:EscU/YscU/HrcU family type III secretion system export apparatus switch protein [Phenylobacterium sp.]
MAEGADPESKTEEATPRKLADARQKGDVAKSPDVAAALSLTGAAAVVLMSGGWFATSMAEQLLPFIAAPHTMLGGLETGAGVEIGAIALWAVAPFLGLVMLATIIGGVGGNDAQSGLIFTAE